jgi:hypothetical protein
MQDAKRALWRIEFRTDMTRAGAPIIPLAFLVEAAWPRGGRWQGMLFRPSLTKNELAACDLQTWAELEAPDPFLRGLFSEAWRAGPEVGAEVLLNRYSDRSAFHIAPQAHDGLAAAAAEQATPHTFAALTEFIRNFKDCLQPVLKADVVDFGQSRRRLPTRTPADVEAASDARLAA